MTQKTVLLVVNDATFFASHRLHLAKAIQQAGYTVHIACPSSAVSDTWSSFGFVVHPIDLQRCSASPVQELWSLLSIWRLYRQVHPDIVHHITIKPVLYGSIIAWLQRVPAVVNAVTGLGAAYEARGVKASLLRGILDICYRLAWCHPNQRIIFQNQDDQQFLARWSGRCFARSCVIQKGAGVDMAKFVPTSLPSQDHTITVVLPARMLWTKGVRVFVQAARQLQQAGHAVRMQLAGGVDISNPDAIAETKLQQWQASGVVEWLGHQTDMVAVYQACDVVCLPALGREGLPKALVEAAACGRPIITTDQVGCREVIVPDQTGLMVTPGSVDDLVKAILYLAESPVLRQNMGQAGRDFVEQDFSEQAIATHTLTLYQDLLS